VLATEEAGMTKVWASAVAVLSLTASGLFTAGAAHAATPAPLVVNFTGDTPGAKANGFVSAGVPQVFLYDTIGSELYVSDYGSQSHGLAISVGGDDASALEIRLSAPTNGISLGFGNDDPSVVNGSDLARLTLFEGTTQVGRVDVNVNANDAMDQTISATSEAIFNRAVLQYVDAVGTPKNIIEIVDDITINPLCTVVGTPGDDNLAGTAGSDVICGDAGDDTISGADGDDLIYGGAGSDTVSGGSGVDTIFGESGDDQISADSGNDVVQGGNGNDTLSGGVDGDQLSGGSGNDEIFGGKGNDKIGGGTGNDNLSGGSGKDVVTGDTGRDKVSGGSGKDQLSGGSGKDQLSGGKGRDHLAGGTGRDHCDGGKSHDTASSCEVKTKIP
jgi:Ca2+-binding RTX toxin-like protein